MAFIALADDNLVPLLIRADLGMALLGLALLALADDTIVVALLARMLGSAAVPIADDCYLVPLGDGADLGGDGDDVGSLGTNRTMANIRRLRGNGASGDAGDCAGDIADRGRATGSSDSKGAGSATLRHCWGYERMRKGQP